jgi:Bacteriophage minor capsid protein
LSADPVTDLLVGVAELLHAAGVGTWNGLGAAAATGSTDTAITVRQTPPAPDRSITLTDYPVTSNARLTDTVTGLNVRVRGTGSPSTASAIAAAIYTALHARGRTALGTAPNVILISDAYLQSEAQVGPDANGRAVRSINYYVRWNRAHARLD